MQKYTPEFSVVIPAFNSLELFREAFGSAIAQRDVPAEIVVTDDSTDGQIRAFLGPLLSQQVRYFHHDPPLGAVKNWNYGISQARGKYILLLHHDEKLPDPDHLKQCQACFEDHDADVVVTNISVYAGGVARSQKVVSALKRLIITRAPSLLFAANLVGPTACVVFRRAQLAPFNDELNWLVDIDWYVRLMSNKNVRYLPGLAVESSFGHQHQITLNINRDQAGKRDQAIIRKSISPFSSVSFSLLLRNLMLGTKNRLKIRKNPLWNEAANR